MIDSRVDIAVTEIIYHNEVGQECTEAEAFGCPSYHHLIHKEHILFFDEVGCNLKGDKNVKVGCQKFIKAQGSEKAHVRVSAGDCHYESVGFTDATGETVLAV